jgi:hypothetical protein
LAIDKNTAFAAKTFAHFACTPSSKCESFDFTAFVANEGCTYTIGSATTNDEYINPTADYTLDFTTSDCQWTSSNSADTDCPLKYHLFYANADGNSGELGALATTDT